MVHEGVLLESETLRASVAGRTEVLDKVKALSLLPDGMHVTTRMVATYFEVGIEAIRSLAKDHREELEANGYRVLNREEVRSFKDLTSVDKYAGRHLALFTRRTVLNVAMLLRDSIVARQVRTYLLDVEERREAPQAPPPVDNLVFHSLVEWLDARIDQVVTHRLEQYDARMIRIVEDTVRTVIGHTVVPLLNHAIRADGERQREIADVRLELARIDRALRARMPAGAMAAMDAMSWREFEDHVAGLCRRDGCLGVTNTSANSDLSADLVGRTADGRTLVVQCKHFAPYRKVESGDMQKFIGMAKVEYEAEVALFVTTATFTTAAMDLAVKHGITPVYRGLLESWSAGSRLRTLD